MNRPIQPDIHPDADSLNAFVERVLPEAEHERVLEHLAGCAGCRDVVYLTRQMAAIEAAPAPVPQVKTEPQRGWWSPLFAHWRVAWIPAAAVAAVGGVVFWVHVRSAQPAADMAQVAPMSAPVANTPPPSQTTARSVASQISSEPGARHAELHKPTEAAGARENKRAETAPAPNLQASQIVLGEMRPENAPLPAAPPVQPRPAMSAPAQVAPEPPLTNTQWQTSQPAQRTSSPALSAKPAEVAPGMVAVHGGVMAPPTGGPQPLGAVTQQSVTQYGTTPQPLNGIAALQLAKRIKLPSGLSTVSSAVMLNRLLAVDSAGALFLSVDAGKHWDAVPVQWTGKAIEVHAQPRAHSADADAGGGPVPVAEDSASPSEAASTIAPLPAPVPETRLAGAEAVPPVPAMLFRLVNDRHRTWFSSDGKTWREQLQNPAQ
jgi:hypothetical protein